MRTYEQRQALRDASTLLSELMLSQEQRALALYDAFFCDARFDPEHPEGLDHTPYEWLSRAQDHIEEEIAQGDRIERANP